jgi:hypothetical protein
MMGQDPVRIRVLIGLVGIVREDGTYAVALAGLAGARVRGAGSAATYHSKRVNVSVTGPRRMLFQAVWGMGWVRWEMRAMCGRGRLPHGSHEILLCPRMIWREKERERSLRR